MVHHPATETDLSCILITTLGSDSVRSNVSSKRKTGPLGVFTPCSHWVTDDFPTPIRRAKTGWLSPTDTRIRTMSWAVYLRGLGKLNVSISRIVTVSSAPTLCNACPA